MSDKLNLAKSYWEAEKDGDIEAVLKHFSVDAHLIAPGCVATGHDEIRKFYETMMGNYAEMRVETRRCVESGDDLVVEFGFHYVRHSGETGYAEGCNVFTVRSEVFSRVRAYFNEADY